MLSTCETCGFLCLPEQESGHEHNTASRTVSRRPVPLSTTDHRRLQIDIVDLDNDIDTIDHQIRRLRASLSSLRRIRKSKKSQLRYARKTSTRSIWSLPVEIIVVIIALATNGDNGDFYHGMPSALSRSCRLFRNIVLATPEIWSQVYIDDTMRGQDRPFATQLFQAYLARSRETPLSVIINSPNNIDDILQCLAPHHSRLYSLELNVCPPGVMAVYRLVVADFPNLNAFHLSVEGIDISGLIGKPGMEATMNLYRTIRFPIEAFRHAPALRDMYIYGMVFTFYQMPLNQFTRFAGDLNGIHEYLSVIGDGLQLVEVDVRLWHSEALSRWNYPSGPVWNTQLSRLSLYADLPCLKFIRLPALEYLRIEETRDTLDGASEYDVGSDIHIFLRGSQCPLETLLLEIPPFELSPLTSILQACGTTLTKLSLRVEWVAATEIYDALTFNGIICLAPNLKDLSLRDDGSFLSENGGLDRTFCASFHGDSFLRMVQSRCNLSLGYGYGARLRSLSLCAPYSARPTQTLEKLAELQREGLAVEFHGYARVAR